MFKSHTKAKPDPDRWLRIASGSAVSRWTSQDRKHRVYLIARHDGGFSCYSEFFSDEEFEHCWIQERAGGSFYDSEEIALREIHAAFPWSRDVTREDYA
jgi:hypothetical protein